MADAASWAGINRAKGHDENIDFGNSGSGKSTMANNARQPWGAHKYASSEARDAMPANLQAWVAGYYEPDEDWSYSAHRGIFHAFGGCKSERPSTGSVTA